MARTWLVRFAARRLTFAGEILPRSGRARHIGLTAETAFDADFAGDVGHLFGKCRQRVGHVVDGFGQRRHFTFRFDGEFLPQIAVRHGSHDFHDAAHLVGQIGGHDVDRVGQILPGSGNTGHVGLTAEFSVGSDFARDARHFRANDRS